MHGPLPTFKYFLLIIKKLKFQYSISYQYQYNLQKLLITHIFNTYKSSAQYTSAQNQSAQKQSAQRRGNLDNNHLEGYHRKLNMEFNRSHPSIYRFIGVLQSHEEEYRVKVQ